MLACGIEILSNFAVLINSNLTGKYKSVNMSSLAQASFELPTYLFGRVSETHKLSHEQFFSTQLNSTQLFSFSFFFF